MKCGRHREDEALQQFVSQCGRMECVAQTWQHVALGATQTSATYTNISASTVALRGAHDSCEYSPSPDSRWLVLQLG